MTECDDIEPLLTPWVDENAGAADRARVDAHLAACTACAARAASERAARTLLLGARGALTQDVAPPALRRRLAAIVGEQGRSTAAPRDWWRVPAAVAATIVLVVGGFHVATGRSTVLLAAQLAADHVKCHWVEGDQGALDAAAVQTRLAAQYGLVAQVPPGSADERLRLIGARRCLTGDGRNAHILYRYEGRAVSLYLLPNEARGPGVLNVLGAHEYVWSRHNSTYVLVADETTARLPELVRYMQRATE